ncbi:MAG: O-antigen ligase family protein [Patescibacteria group bacterium]|jgi:O-antigen ligase
MQKILEKIFIYGLIAILFTPLLIGDSLVFPFITTKAYYFYIVVDILLAAYLLILTKKPLYPKKNKYFLFFIILTLVGFVFDLFGVKFLNSFWGNYERMMGIYTSLHFLAYLWLLLSVFNTKEKYLKLFKISLVISFLVGIYAILQKMQVVFYGMLNIDENRSSATFGNPAYFAGYLLIFIFMAAYMLLRSKQDLVLDQQLTKQSTMIAKSKKSDKYWSYFYVLSILLNTVILYFTATRGALLGLVGGAIVGIILVIIFHHNRKIKVIALTLLLVVALGLSSIFIFKQSSFIKNNLTLARISEISMNDVTTASRIRLWKMSVKAVQDRPIFGYGANNMRLPLDKYHDYNLFEDWFDSSHNKFFDELLAHGYIGLGLQIAFFVALFILILKKINEDLLGNATLFALLVAYVVQAMFIFDVFIVNLSFILILGFLFLNFTDKTQTNIRQKKISVHLAVPVIIIMVFVFSYIYSHAIRPAHNIILAGNLTNNDMSTAIDIYKKVDNDLFANYDIFASAMAKTAMEVFKNNQQYTDVQIQGFVTQLTKVYERAIEDSGGYSYFYINLAKMYQIASVSPRLDYLDQSLTLLNTALVKAPNRLDIYYALAQGYFMKGDVVNAEDNLNKALALGVRQGEIYYKLAEIRARKGDPELAMSNINKSIEFGKILTFEELESFAKLFIDRERWSEAVQIFIKMDEMQPNSADTYANIALTYSKLGDKQKAIEWINKISVLDPSKADQVKEFIRGLK